MPSKTRVFFLNALSVTFTMLLVRGVSVLFNIYVAGLAGSEAMGLFALIGSVYAFSVTLATSGINLGVTRLVSDALGLCDEALALASVKRAMLLCFISGGLASVALYFLSPAICEHLLEDARALSPLRLLALTLVPVAQSSCLSGYFTAVRRVKASSVSQVLVQIFKVGVTVLFLSRAQKDAESACLALVLGGAVASFAELAISYALYLIDKRRLNSPRGYRPVQSPTKKLLGITLPVTFSSSVRSALSMLQHSLIPRGLRASGKSPSSALSSYGALHSMAMPLLLFPSALIYGFAGLLIPEVSECCVQRNFERLERVSYRATSLSLFFSIGISGIALFFSEELGLAIFRNAEAARYIRILAPLVPVMYVDGAMDAILKGSGHQVYSMNVNIADSLTACVFAVTLIPRLGIWGYIISIYATEIMNTALSLSKVISVSRSRPRIFHQLVMPILCVIGATNLTRLLLHAVGGLGEKPSVLAISVTLTAAVYCALLFITRTVGADEKEFLNAAIKR